MADAPAFRLAYVHVLPIEYYPPATNTISILAERPGWNVRVWTSANARGGAAWSHPGLDVRRPFFGKPHRALTGRIAGYLQWHITTALELARWKPHAVIAVEPHSALGVWIYYRTLGGGAPLFIHHHEYYAPEDYARPGMRLLAAAQRIEQDSLLAGARWVSQTNATRMQLMLSTHPKIVPATAHVLPNYPPSEWVAAAARQPSRARANDRTRLVYVGSASFEDTFIREAAQWVAANPERLSLHVVGNNVARDVWDWLSSLRATNITTDPGGIDYPDLPALLAQHDVGLVLYKGNTLNFVHNVPNKAIEYLACGLEVWYPPEMKEMRVFGAAHPNLRTREVNFSELSSMAPMRVEREPVASFPFTAEGALEELTTFLERCARSE